MKKTLLILAVCGMTLSACTSEDVLKESPQSNLISFRNVINRDTRALDGSNFSLFYVYGYYTRGADLTTRFNIFTDTPVTKSNGTWSSSINRYWVPDANYSFYAYSCENKHVATEYGGPSLGQFDGVFRLNYTCHSENGNSHDLVFASSTDVIGQEEDNDPVALQFKHILSKVDLNFVSDFPVGYDIEISNISISQFQNTGTFTANKKSVDDSTLGSWGSVDYDSKSTNSFTLNTLGNSITTNTGDINNPAAPVRTSSCYVIPHHYTTADNPVKIQFDIKVTNKTFEGEDKTILSNTLIGTWHPNWRMGTYYTYTIRLSGGAAGMDEIKFGVGIDDWNNPAEDNKPETIQISLDYKVEKAENVNPAE